MGEMDPDLVGAAGLQTALQQAGSRLAVIAGVGREQVPMGHRLAAALAHRALVARAWVAVERGVDRAPRAERRTPSKGKVAALKTTIFTLAGELRRQRLVGMVVLGHHHQATGVLVEPVHDARPLDAADAGQAVAAMRD